MPWMLTHTGAAVDLRHLEPSTLSALDIAHSLANTLRFNGHTVRPYSVAEHSLLVVEIMQREWGIFHQVALHAGLMHDAHEAYCGDLSSPMKQLLGPIWQAEEDRIQRAVLQRFGLLRAFENWQHFIKQADFTALATERRDLMSPAGPKWESLNGVKPAAWVNLRDRDGMTADDWRTAFLDRMAELSYAETGA